VLAEGVREAYDDLFQVNINAQTLSKSELINKFRTLSQGQFSESVLDKMAMTFTELVKLADFTAPPAPKPAAAAVEDVTPPGEPKKEKEVVINDDPRPRRIKVDGLVYNIQLILPESRDQVVYDALFRSLREHLG
jgi:hypothetical protein